MQRQTSRRALAVLGSLATAAAVALSGSPAEGAKRPTRAQPRGATCDRPVTAGSGASLFALCFNDDGNLVSVTSPAAHQHIFRGHEGYAICSRNEETAYFDFGTTELGFDPPTVSQPNGPGTLPITVTRETGDGDFRYTQKAAWSPGNFVVTLTMSVKNQSATDRPSFKMARYFDGNVSGTATDRYARSLSSVWGWDDATGDAFGLSARNPGITYPRENEVALSSAFDPSDPCFVSGIATPTGLGDFYAEQIIDLGALKAGKTKTAAVAYLRF